MDANEREFKNRLIRVYACAFAVGESWTKNKILNYSSTKDTKMLGAVLSPTEVSRRNLLFTSLFMIFVSFSETIFLCFFAAISYLRDPCDLLRLPVGLLFRRETRQTLWSLSLVQRHG
jgi:hypothetical protein